MRHSLSQATIARRDQRLQDRLRRDIVEADRTELLSVDLDWAYNSGKMDAIGTGNTKWSARSPLPPSLLGAPAEAAWSSAERLLSGSSTSPRK